MIPPHGGKLVDRVLSGKERENALLKAKELFKIKINLELIRDIENIAKGVFSPLEGFLCKEDFNSVLNHMRLSNDLPWTIPIVFDVPMEIANKLKEGQEIALVNSKEEPVAILHLEEKYTYDKEEYARKVFQTTDVKHPGVAKIKAMNDVLLGGKIDLIKQTPSPFERYNLSPLETRVLFKEKGWKTIVGFQTRNTPHIGHEYVQKTALTFTDGIFVNPVIGKKKKGDFKDEVILKAYEELIKNYYLKERAVMSILQTEMRYAGPREAIFHAIVRKNFGCTHFIIGRDHAGVGNFYPPYAAQDIFSEFPDLGIVPLFFKSFFYCKKCNSVENEKTCPHPPSEHINFSGTKIRELIIKGETPPPELMRPEVAKIIMSYENPFVE
ncbi:sulfate adenylyltransferase [SCandidatus Aminicenantes bacterium Aminicenantia_JdfR_composite]|jgi:sulfate adenylyltransferase|nr:sulfate adenylyltransferase [SCandidatus Aminicenantes bacterium Aminicenantia_JdfR_composite]MCP2596934.1 sulfate adenylyltransferase [Candidatus Aminicenantes bacterium AC-335-G13]